ncbi:MAG: carboxymuconolactone decarboxylase family protein [Ottowia sp.]|uniref:carboxymuconolactone decarboxylase family protein n=1 Tax=Ottowia sp. TaxID=1898956 RepID=UPI003C759433
MDQNTPTTRQSGFSPEGEASRRKITGDEYVDGMLAGKSPFDEEWQMYCTNQLWGRTWQRGILEPRQLSLLTMGMLAGLGRMEEFEMHFRIALKRTGLPLVQLREALLHIGMYCGIPIARDAFVIARRVLKEEGVDLSELDVPTP